MLCTVYRYGQRRARPEPRREGDGDGAGGEAEERAHVDPQGAGLVGRRLLALVERFDIEPFPDFSAK